MCGLETTTLTGLFITAKLFVDVAVSDAGHSVPTACFVMYVVITVQRAEQCAALGLCSAYLKGALIRKE